MFIADDLNQFKTLFVSRLKSMLSADELGAFILVLANAQQDMSLNEALENETATTFSELKKKWMANDISAAVDDIDVFRQLLNVETNRVSLWQHRNEGDWEISYNAMRALRPARASSQILQSIKMAFDENKFHFNKPYLAPEILWQGVYQNTVIRVLYNKFPFSDYHLLIALAPERQYPQVLTEDAHCLLFSLVTKTANVFPGFGAGFNTLAAGASVNHLHFQAFIRERPFPIENFCWHHNGGNSTYPLDVKTFSEAAPSWQYMDALMTENQAFNCIYRQGVCYVVRRLFQGSVVLPGWLAGAGWLDVAGVMTVSDSKTFEALDAASITQSLALMAV